MVGVGAGVALGEPARNFEVLGTVFLRLLRMVVIPLIMSSIMSGMVRVGNAQNLGRLGLHTFVYYLTTSLLAIATGLVLVNILKPGVGADLNLQRSVEELDQTQASFRDLLLRLIPENPFAALVEGDLLAVVFFSVVVGICIPRLADTYQKPLVRLIEAVFQVMMYLTRVILRLAPLGVFGLVTGLVATTGLDAFGSLALYMGTVASGLAIHAVTTLPLLVWLVGRADPRAHVRAMAPALTTAFATASSSATLPLTMQCAEKEAGISNKVSSLVLPLGATINMDGTALYEGVAVLFIAQAYGVDLTAVQQGTVLITALLVSVGAAGIPMAGLIMMSVILQAVDLPLEGAGLVLAVDRVLDMLRTATNVWSDSCAARIVATLQGEPVKN